MPSGNRDMLILFDLASIAFLFSLLLTPLVRDLAKRWGLVDQPDGQRKLHAEPVPRVGGVGVALAFCGALGLMAVLPYGRLNLDLSSLLPKVYALLPATAVVFLTGLIDDLRGLRPWQKLTGLLIAGALAYQAGFGITTIGGHELPVWLSLPVTLLWLAGTANALNLVDGMDGLAAGVGTFACVTTLIAGLTHGANELALAAAPLAGALLGFLRYNFNPASVFLGDSGSLTVGFLLGAFGAMWGQKSATILGMTAPLMAMAVPILEVGMSIVRRALRNEPIFGADRGHFHHHLLRKGFTPQRAVLLIYAFCGAAAALALLQDMAHARYGGFIIVLFCITAWVGIQHLGYVEFGMAGEWIAGGAMRRTIGAQMRLQEFERGLGAAATLAGFREAVLAGAREFGFRGARLRLEGDTQEWNPAGEGGWRLDVPLPGGNHVTLWHDPESDVHPIVLASFPAAVSRILKERRGTLLRNQKEAASTQAG